MAGVLHGNSFASGVITLALTPASVAPNTTAEQLFPVTGLQVGDFVSINKPTGQAGLGIVGMRVAGANSLGITFINATIGALVPTAAELYLIRYVRLDAVINSVRA